MYFQQAPWFSVKEKEGKICLLKKYLYGLKQSPRAWFEKFSQVVIRCGLRWCRVDHSDFLRYSSSGDIILVYIDDIVITGSDVKGIEQFKKFLSQFSYERFGQFGISLE